MSNTKHSEAPWRDTFTLGKERGVRNAGGYICFLPKPNHYSGQDERYEQELEEYKANAKLIASAPSLLEALKTLLTGIEYAAENNAIYAITTQDIELIKDAIQNAENH